MRFMQIMTFYPPYLEQFHAARPQLAQAGHGAIMQAMFADAFACLHVVAPYMDPLGYETRLIIANDSVGQHCWAAEHGLTLAEPAQWKHEIVRRQIEAFAPDILYVSDVVVYDGRFLRSLAWRPRVIAGWRGAEFAPDTDCRGYDLILSHQRKILQEAPKRGARTSARCIPGFPAWVAEAVADTPCIHDLVVSMQWNPRQHAHRNHLVEFLALASGRGKRFDLGLYLANVGGQPCPGPVAALDKGPRWGLDMFRALRSGRLSFNAESDFNRGEAGNMRFFESVGVGRLLLTEHHPGVDALFTPGEEIETFASEPELLEKVIYYKRFPEEAEAIAARGQARCLRDYGIDGYAGRLDRRLRKVLARG